MIQCSVYSLLSMKCSLNRVFVVYISVNLKFYLVKITNVGSDLCQVDNTLFTFKGYSLMGD